MNTTLLPVMESRVALIVNNIRCSPLRRAASIKCFSF
nr:MAG TPA: hypothetical protein [Caudoviricetes sp.]